jgi:Lrp/AsnC family transcriptional regulator for asnA, asnC and gidA
LKSKQLVNENDIKIIKTLLKDARTPFTNIAKNLNITSSAARNRYIKLKKAGIINGAIMKINPKRLGLDFIGLSKIKANPQKIRELKSKLKNLPYILSVFPLEDYSLGFRMALPNSGELEKLVNKIQSLDYVQELKYELHFGTPRFDYPENIVLKKVKIKNQESKNLDFESSETKSFDSSPLIPQSQTSEIRSMDSLDKQIVKKLSINARVSFSVIAKQLDISVNKIIRRFRLIQDRFFMGSSITLDLSKLGYKAEVQFEICKTSSANIDKLAKKIKIIPNAMVVIKVLGDYNLLVIFPVSTIDEVLDLQKRIRSLEEVEAAPSIIRDLPASWPPNFMASFL